MEMVTVREVPEEAYVAVVHAYALSVRYAVVLPSSSYTLVDPEEPPGTIWRSHKTGPQHTMCPTHNTS